MKSCTSWYLLAWLYLASTAQSSVHVKNGDFTATDEQGVPLDWSPIGGTGPIQSKVQVVPRQDSSSCLYLEIDTKSPWQMEGTVEGTLTAGQSYSLSCEARTEAVSGIVQVNLYGHGGSLQDLMASISIPKTDDWRECKATIRPHQETQPLLRIEGKGSCRLYLDNITLTPLIHGRSERAPNAPMIFGATSLARRVGKILQVEELLLEGPGWTREHEAQEGLWILTQADPYSDIWMDGLVLRSPKTPQPETILSLNLQGCLPGTYKVFLSDPGGTLEIQWKDSRWERVVGGKGEIGLGILEMEDPEWPFKIRTPARGKDVLLPCYLDYIRLIPALGSYDKMNLRSQVEGKALPNRVPLQGEIRGKTPFLSVPVRVGFPLPKGRVRDASLPKLELDGTLLPSQAETLSSWSDESLRWLTLRSVIAPDVWREGSCAVSFPPSSEKPEDAFQVMEENETLWVKGKAIELAVDKITGEISSLRQANQDFLEGPSYIRIQVPFTTGPVPNILLSRLHAYEVEDTGPVYLRLRLDGDLTSIMTHHVMQYRLRLEFHEGIPGFFYELFLAPRDHKSPFEVIDVAWIFPLIQGPKHTYCFPTEYKRFVHGVLGSDETITLLQRNFHEYELLAESPTNRDIFHTGSGHPGWASFGTGTGFLVFQSDHFQAMHPSAFQCDPTEASIRFFPAEQVFGKAQKWFHGSGRTCSGWVLAMGQEQPRDLDHWFEATTTWPLFTPTSEWIQDCRVRQDLPARNEDRFQLYERMVEYSFQSCTAKSREWDDTGFFNFGDHSLARREGFAHWSNLRFGLPHVLFTEGLRRESDSAFLARAASAAFHQGDVDMDHHTGGIRPQGVDHVQFPARPKQGWVRSFFDAWYIQGSPRHGESATTLGNWYLQLQEEDPFSLVQSCDDLCSALSAMVDLYRETGENKYWEGLQNLYAYVRRWQDQKSGLWFAPMGSDPRKYGVELNESAHLVVSLTELHDIAEVEGLDEMLSLAAEGLSQAAAHPSIHHVPDLSRLPFFKISLARAIGAVASCLQREDLMKRAMQLFDEGIQDGQILGRDFDILATTARQTPRFLAQAAAMEIYPSNDTSRFFYPTHFGSLFEKEGFSFHPFFLASPPRQWRFFLLKETDQPFEVTVYKKRIGEGCYGEVFLEDAFRSVVERARLEADTSEKITLRAPLDKQKGTYQLRMIDEGPKDRDGSCLWSLSVNPPLPLVLEAPSTLRITSMEPVQYFFQVSQETQRLWCRIALKRKGGIRASFVDPNETVLVQKEILMKQTPGPQPTWEDLIVDLPARTSSSLYQIRIEGTIDVLLQPRQMGRYLSTSPQSHFEPEVKDPWDR